MLCWIRKQCDQTIFSSRILVIFAIFIAEHSGGILVGGGYHDNCRLRWHEACNVVGKDRGLTLRNFWCINDCSSCTSYCKFSIFFCSLFFGNTISSFQFSLKFSRNRNFRCIRPEGIRLAPPRSSVSLTVHSYLTVITETVLRERALRTMPKKA